MPAQLCRTTSLIHRTSTAGARNRKRNPVAAAAASVTLSTETSVQAGCAKRVPARVNRLLLHRRDGGKHGWSCSKRADSR
jgi:hypothetical protein